MALLRISRAAGSPLLSEGSKLLRAPLLRRPLVRNCGSGISDGTRRQRDVAPEDAGVENAASLQKLRKEVKGLRSDVKKLSMMLEQDFVGYRRSGHRTSAEGESAWWRSSLQGAANLTSETDPAESRKREEVRPSVQTAMLQPTHVSEMGHSTLAHLALQGNHFAHRERLIREVMSVDNISWDEAHQIIEEMDKYKERYYWFVTMPFRVGIVAATFLSIASCLLVFHPPTAHWYGVNIAGEELPDDKKHVDDMTINQVGSWTWNWMEPMIGTASFVLLCAQFMRGQFLKLQMKTFLEMMESRKATALARKFHQYDKSMVRTWAKPLPKATMTFMPIYERSTGLRGPSSGL